MTPALERKLRDERYAERAVNMAVGITAATVLVPAKPEVHETAERDGAYVSVVLWVPAEGITFP